MAENSSGKRMLISFTLPISCQICLGKVKQPIVCPNHHVFCSVCIELWLQHNQQCPTCRIPITPENPCKQIIGGQTQENDCDNHMSNPALRRARFDILYQDCENEIKRLQQENETLQASNFQLQEQLGDTRRALASKQNSDSSREALPLVPSSDEATPKAKIKTWRDLAPVPPSSSPSASKVRSRAQWAPSDASLGTRQDQHGVQTSNQQDGGCTAEPSQVDGNGDMLAALRSKLKQATSTYDRIKQDMDKLKEKNASLSSDNRALRGENGRLKQAAATQSPRKYEKYTSMAQQSKLEQRCREVAQLKSALERSDSYIEELETKLQDYRSLFGSLPRKRPCHTENTVHKALKPSGGETHETTAANSENLLAFRRRNENQGDIRESDEACPPSSDRNPPAFLGKCSSLFNGIDPTDSNIDPSTHSLTGPNMRQSLKREHNQLILNKKARCERLKVQPDCDDSSDLDGPSPVGNTPSTSLGRLSLDSSQKLPKSSFSFDSEMKNSPSCHRQLDFWKDPQAQHAAWEFSLGSSETRGLMLEGNLIDSEPLDENATFSDLNFTLTTEFSDCAQLMKEAEKRVKTKKLCSKEEELWSTTQDKLENKPLTQHQAIVRNANPVNRDRENIKYFTQVTSSQDDRFEHQVKNPSASIISHHDKLRNFDMNFHLDNTQVTWSKNRLQWSASTEHQESLTLTSSEVARTSWSGSSCEPVSYSSTKQSTIPRSTAAPALRVEPRRANCFQPAIKPVLMKLEQDTDTPEYGTFTSSCGSQLKSQANNARDALGTAQRGIIQADDKVTAHVRLPCRGGNTMMAAYGMDTKRFSSYLGQACGRQDQISESHKRVRLDQGSDDSDD